MFNQSKPYSLWKSRRILKSSCKWYKKNHAQLSPTQLTTLEDTLQKLDQSLLIKDREQASQYARKLEEFGNTHFKKSLFDYSLEIAGALVFALVIAVVVRQVWFELYEIPSGSMRPTFKEKDRLTVTKTTFGINVPLMTKHFYFDPHLVQRCSVVIWSGDEINHLNSDSTFLGIFPYTKRYIKRCLGKPGDRLYFYGGKIYGIDKDGQDLIELRDGPWLEKLDHVPFIHFEGRIAYIQDSLQPTTAKAVFNHINQAIGQLTISRRGLQGDIFNGKEWVKDNPKSLQTPHETIETYADFYGIKNFAQARILTKKQAKESEKYHLDDMAEGKLYLELRHTPNLIFPEPIISERYGVIIPGYQTTIPLQEQHLKTLMENMYTARFVVKNGLAYRYVQDEPMHVSSKNPSFKNVPDGTYEFYYGKAYEIGWGGIAKLLPANHPLYEMTDENVQRLFNFGMEFSKLFSPDEKNTNFFPNRYAYFRDGDLYVLGGLLFKKDDSILKAFNELEKKREETSSSKEPYIAFKDYGPPLKDNGQLDKDLIQTFGYRVPEKQYLMLGDNHAMSQDSRWFGAVPQENLQGAPSFILWPPGERWGRPNQKPYPIITTPRLIVWSIILAILVMWYIIHQRRIKKPIFVKAR